MRHKRAHGIVPGLSARTRAGLLRTTALQAAVIVIVAAPGAAWAQPAPNARPTGGVVVGGSASIGQTASTTTVTQSSQRAAVDWRSFDVGSSQTVQFQQPGASAVVLNRVTGPNPSQIAGRIQANGQVVITNQSGVTFHQGAQVDTAGLIVSAAGITPQNFMAGRMVFDQAARPDAQVSNAGTITIKEAGLAALVAPRVANSGVIQAKMGHVILAGAETHTLDMYGDGLLSIDVTRQVRQAPRGPDGKASTALVTNTGTIMADGGTVLLTASAVDGVVQTLVQAGGRIQANTAQGRQGTVVLTGVGGSVRIEGQVAADGRAPGSTGGAVTATATGAVTVAAGARVTANGAAGGGTVAIGSRASGSATVEAGAKLAANARTVGNGGKVSVISAGTTTLAGGIAARGGRTGGNGGEVEVSGHTVVLGGAIDTAAPAGHVGSVLLDPGDTYISDHGAPPGDTVFTPAQLQAINGDVTVSSTGAIVADSSVSLTGGSSGGLSTGSTTQNFILSAANSITVSAGVTLATSGSIRLTAGAPGISILGNLTPGAATLGLSFNTTGAVTQGPSSTITASQLVGAVGSLAFNSVTNQISGVGSVSTALTASTGGISVTSAAALTVSGVAAQAGVVVPSGQTISFTADTITLRSPRGNPIASAPLGTIALQPLTPGRPMEVTGGAATPGTLSVPSTALPRLNASTLSLGSAAGGALTLAPDGTTIDFGLAGFSGLNLLSGGAIGQVGAIAVPTVTGSGGGISLTAASNALPIIGAGGLTAAAGNVALNSGANALAVNGPVAATGNVSLASSLITTGVSLALNANITGVTVNLSTDGGGFLGNSGKLQQTSGSITAQSLGGAASAATLGQTNAVGSIGNFHTVFGFSLTNAPGLSVTTLLQNDTGAMTLNLGGALTQAAGSSVSSPILSGTATAMTLTSPTNLVRSLANFTTSAGGIALTTTLAGLDGPGFASFSLGGVVATPAGSTIAIVADQVVTAAGASISAVGGGVSFTPLTAGRAVELVGAATEQSSAALSLIQADLGRIQTGTLTLGSATAGPILLGQTNDAITLTGTATTLSLLSSGAVTQGTGASLVVPTLSANAASVTLGGANGIGVIGALTTSGNATVNTTQTLTVAGPLAVGGTAAFGATSGVILSGTTLAANLSLSAGAAGISQTGGSVSTPGAFTLTTSGAVTQSGGAITAGTLTGSAGSVVLTGGGNQITNLGPFTSAGAFSLTDGRTLTIAGAVDPADVTMNIAGNLVINSSITAATLTLNATGTITEASGTGVVAATLTGSAASASFDQTNRVGTLAGFTTASGFTLNTLVPLAVTGPVIDGASIGIGGGQLTITGNLTAPVISLTAARTIRPTTPGSIIQSSGIITATTTLTLTAADAVSQTGGGIVAGTLTGSAGGAAAFGSTANQVTTLGAFSSVGGFSLNNSQTLNQAGALGDTVSIGLNVTGGLALGGTLSAPAVNLVASGAITQPGGSIATTTLTGSGATVALSSTTNAVTSLGAFVAAGNLSLADTGTLTIAGGVQAGGSTPVLSLISDGFAVQGGGSLTAAGGTVSLAPLTAGTALNLSSFVAGGTTSAITASTLRVGNATTGPITITGAFNLTGVGTLSLVSGGAVSETATGAITVGALTANAASVSLTGANLFTTLGAVTTTGLLAVTNAQTLGVSGALSGAGGVTLNVTGALALGANVSGSVVSLTASGAITQPGGIITATTLSGSAASAVFGGANQIANLSTFTATTALSVTDARSLTVTGLIDPPDVTLNVAGDLVINNGITGGTVTLIATGAITEAGSGGSGVGGSGVGGSGVGGSITATILQGSAASALLNLTNTVRTLAGFTTATGFTLANASGLSVSGPVVDGASITIGARGALTLSGAVTAPSVSLNASRGLSAAFVPGTITQTAGTITASTGLVLTAADTVSQTGGSIVAGQVGGSSGGTTALNGGTNQIGTLASYGSVGGFSLIDNRALSQTGTLTDSLQIGLNVTGALALGGTVSAPTVTLVATGAVTQPGGGITATTLTGSTGAAGLTAPGNAVANLGAFTSAGNFSLTDGSGLNVTGAVVAGGATPLLSLASNSIGLQTGGSLTAANGTVALAPATPGTAFSLTSFVPGGSTSAITATTLQVGNATAGAITIGGPFNLAGVTTLNLLSAGAVTETGTGAVNVGTLTATAASLSLTGANRVTTLGAITTTGLLSFTSAQDLAVSGALNGPGGVTLNVTGGLALGGNVTGSTVSLTASGAITQPGGIITATTLTGSAASAVFGAANQVTNLGAFIATTTLSVTDARALAVTGAIDPPDVTLNVTGDLAINSSITGGTVTLIATGNITEGAGGSVTAATLRGSGNTALLTQTNTVAALAGFATTGGFALVDGGPLGVTGPLTDGVSIALTSGPLSLNGTITAPSVTLTTVNTIRPTLFGTILQNSGTITASGSLTVNAASTVSQAGGAIVAGQLGGSSGGSTTLNQAANRIGTLAGYSSAGGFSLVDGRALSQTGALADTVQIGLTVAGALTLNGSLSAPTVNLAATGAVTQPGGGITATTLTGAAGAASLTAAGNAVTNLGAFTSTGNFSLVDGSALNVTGAVQAGGATPTLSLASNSIALQAGGSLTATNGTVALAPATPGTAFSLSSFVPAGTTSAITAATLQVGNATTGAITIGGPFNLTGVGTLTLLSAAAVTETGTGAVTVGTLTATAASLALTGPNRITTLGAVTTTGLLAVSNAQDLAVAGALTGAGGVTLNITGALALGANVTGSTVSLSASGAITQPGGVITAATLTGAAGSAVFGAAGNQVTNLGAFASAGALSLTDGRGLVVSGAVSGGAVTLAPAGDLTLNSSVTGTSATFTAAGAITEGASGSVSAATLSGSAASAVLTQTNTVGTLAGFTTTSGFSLTDGAALTVAGPVVDGSAVALISNGPLSIGGAITAPAVSLQAIRVVSTPGPALGSITQTGGTISASTSLTLTAADGVLQSGGSIVAGQVGGSSGGTTALNGTTNQIGTLAAYGSVGGFSLADNRALAQTGALTDTAQVALSVAGALTLNGSVTAPAVSLIATGAITQPGGGVTATTLTGAAATVALTAAGNAVTNLGAFTSAGNFSLVDGSALNVTGAVQTGGATPTLSLTSNGIGLQAGGSLVAAGGTVALAPLTAGTAFALTSFVPAGTTSAITAATLQVGNAAAGAITIGGAFNLSGIGTLTLLSAGAVTETGTGALTVGSLTATAGSLSLTGANRIGTLGPVTTTGAITVTDAQGLTVGGALTGPGGIALTVTGDLALAASLTAPTVTLVASGAITQPGGVITATTLTGSAASAAFGRANQVTNLGAFTATTGFALTDARSLTVTGALDPPDVTLNVTGDLAINSSITGNTVTLIATGNITEGAGGTVSAATLQGSGKTALLTRTNAVGTLAGFATSGGFSLLDGGALAVTGPVTDGVSIALSSGPLSVGGNITAPGVTLTAISLIRPAAPGTIALNSGTITASGSLTLTAASTVTQPGGSIVAGQLGGSSGGSTTLNQAANRIGTLAGYSSVGGFSLVDGQALSQTGALTDTVQVALNATGALALNGTVTAPTVNLASTSAVTQPGGSITATTLTGATGGATLTAAGNAVTNLGAFTSTGDFSLVDGSALNVTGAVLAGGAAPTLSLASNSVALQAGGSLSAVNGAVRLAPSTAGAAFSLTSFVPAGTTSAVTANTLQVGNATAGAITVDGAFNLSAVNILNLVSAGAVSETAAGSLTVAALSGSSASLSLTGTNRIGAIGNIQTAGATQISDAQSLTVANPITAGASFRLDVAGGISIASTIGSPLVTLNATGAIATSGSGAILGIGGPSTLTGSAASAVFGGAGNAVGTLVGFTTTGGDFSLTTGSPLTLTGAVAAAGNLTLATGGALAINSGVSGNTVTLTAAGSVVEGAGGSLAAKTLTGASSGATLNAAGNAVSNLAAFNAGGFSFSLVDGSALNVTGAVQAAPTLSLASNSIALQAGGSLTAAGGTVALTPATPGSAFSLTNFVPPGTTTAITAATLQVGNATAGAITIGGAFSLGNVGTLALQSAAAVTEAAGGSLSVANLTAAAASLGLTGANTIAALGAITTTGATSITDGQSVTVNGPVAAGGALLLTVTGNVALAGAVTAPTVTLAASGDITEPGGRIATGTLSATALSLALPGANQIATLGPIATAAGLSINDGVALTVNGALTDGVLIQLSTLGSASTIALAGNLTAPTVTLNGGAGITQSGGAIIATTLNGSSGAGPVAFTSTGNQIANFSFNTPGDLTLTDGRSVAATFASAGNATLAVTGDIVLGAPFSAGSVVTLTATGAISEAPGAVLNATTLQGSAGSVQLDMANRVVQLGTFTSAGNFRLVDGAGGSLTVTGAVTAQGPTQSLSLSSDVIAFGSGSSLTAAGGTVFLGPTTAGAGFNFAASTGAAPASVTAATLQVGSATTANINILGGWSLPNVGTLNLVSSGAIAGGSNLSVPRLTATGGSLALTSATIPTLGPSTLAGALTLLDGISPLTLQGQISAGGPVSLLGSSIAIGSAGGAATLTTPGAVNLATTAGFVTETNGAIVAGSLTGSSFVTTLTGNNLIGSLGPFTSRFGFALTNGTALNVTGAVDGGTSLNLTTTAGGINFAASAGASQTTVNAAGGITESRFGGLSGSTASLSAGSSILLDQVNGIGTLIGATARGAISVNVGLSPLVIAGTVSAGGPITLTSGALAIGTATATSFSLTGGSTGTTPATAASIVTPGTLTINARGAVTEPNGTISVGSLTGAATSVNLGNGGNQVSSLGAFTAQGGFSLTDGRSLVVNGAVDPPDVTLNIKGDLGIFSTITGNTVTLNVTGGVSSGPGGAVNAATLTGAAASLSLNGANTVGTLGTFFTASDFSLANGAAPLTIAGPVNSGGRFAVTTTGALTLSGNVAAPFVTLNAGGITQTGGAIQAAQQLFLGAAGGISQSGGTMATALLSGFAGGPVSLANNNSVGTLGNFSTGAGFSLANGANQGLVVGGTVGAGSLELTAPSVGFAGVVSTGALSVTAAGGISQTAGTVQAASLTGSAGTTVQLGGPSGTAIIGTLGSFSAGQSLTLGNGGVLSVTGPLQAPAVSLAAAGPLLLQGGSIAADRLALSGSSVFQRGTTIFAPRTASLAQVSLNTGGGPLSLQNLVAPQAALTLNLGAGGASGTLVAGSLLVNGTLGTATLFGTVGGLTGFDAAIASRITPAFNVDYTMNGCAIASVTCTVQAIERIFEPDLIRVDFPPFESALRPDLFTADLLQLDITRDPTDPSLALPNISDRDY